MIALHLVPSLLSPAGSLSDIDIVSHGVISLKQRRCKLIHICIQLTGRTGFEYFESTWLVDAGMEGWHQGRRERTADKTFLHADKMRYQSLWAQRHDKLRFQTQNTIMK